MAGVGCLDINLSELQNAKTLDQVKDFLLGAFRGVLDFSNGMVGDNVWIDVDGSLVRHIGPDESGAHDYQRIILSEVDHLDFDARGHKLEESAGHWYFGVNRRFAFPHHYPWYAALVGQD